ncbi:Kinesin-like protein KIN-14R [Clonorchis sinensis]|uniref:Kinesin-like protein KIN-14R n=1 Tax=Clonorchis sinensis TaxID=79923 RepID=A0A8T1MVU6_CLOSI|nr:Kinesin-like protein KIN-14R [Clonorchis sinensis]
MPKEMMGKGLQAANFQLLNPEQLHRSTILKSKNTTIISDSCTTDHTSNVIETDISDKFTRKPPTAFVHSDDWSLYLRVCCQLRQIRSNYGCTELEAQKLIHTGRRRSQACILRLIFAFNHLYSEYSRIVFTLNSLQNQDHCLINTALSRSYSGLSTSQTVQDSTNHGDTNVCKSNPVFKGQDSGLQDILEEGREFYPEQHQEQCSGTVIPVTHSLTAINTTSTSLPTNYSLMSHTAQEVTEIPMQSTQTGFSETSTPACFQWCRKHSGKRRPLMSRNRSYEALKVSRAIETSKNFSNKHRFSDMDSYDYFDQIKRSPTNKSLAIFQVASHQWRIEHRTQLSSKSTASQTQHVANKRMEFIRLPIALELILPRMQKQIETVMISCQHVYDPLEVASELRQMNYDTEACIAYFQKTRPLRDIIHEFLSDKDPFDRKAQHIRSSRQPRIEQNIPNSLLTFLLEIQSCVVDLKQAKQDAAHKLCRLRAFVNDTTASVERALREKLENYLFDAPKYDKIIPLRNGDLALSELSKLVQENQSLKQTLQMEEDRRKNMFNMMQEYFGNVRVYCRCRGIPKTKSCLEVHSLDTVVLMPGSDAAAEQYKFDRVFDINTSQTEVYKELSPFVSSFLDGYNVCFLTYGSEASGKTYTLLGGPDDKPSTEGIAQRALRTVLSEKTARRSEWEYQLLVSVVEVYNDTLTDILTNENGIHLHIESGPDHMMDDIHRQQIEKDSDIDDLLALCRTRRRVGRTALNLCSSRSHLIIFAQLNARSRIHDTSLSSILALCDLAGFEDVIKADTLGDPILAKEAGYINRSLTALNRVFMSLRSQDPTTVSYRDSKLTYLLKPFFSSSGKCILIVTVRTDRVNLASTQSTLRFGRESRGVSLGRARRQLNLDRIMNELRST